MEIQFIVNGSVKFTLTPKTELMKAMAELVKDEAVYKVTKPNNSSEIIFTLVEDKKEN